MIEDSPTIRAINQVYPGFYNLHKEQNKYYKNNRDPNYFMKQFEEALSELERKNERARN